MLADVPHKTCWKPFAAHPRIGSSATASVKTGAVRLFFVNAAVKKELAKPTNAMKPGSATSSYSPGKSTTECWQFWKNDLITIPVRIHIAPNAA